MVYFIGDIFLSFITHLFFNIYSIIIICPLLFYFNQKYIKLFINIIYYLYGIIFYIKLNPLI